jgi:peptidoglycan-associated lipoprotein
MAELRWRNGERTSYSEEMTVMISSFRMAAVALLVASLAVSACGKKKVAATPPPPPPAAAPPPTTTPPPPAPSQPPPPTPPSTPAPAEETLDDLNRSGVLKPAYFALDSFALSTEARGVVQANADYLKKRATAKVMIEGHADSRGTSEYNLALGERRANAVRDYLVSLGVANDRVTTVSKGKEQPFCKEETESCWAQNRVGFFIFTAK